MSLKRSGAYRHAWLIALPAPFFLGYECVVIAHLVALGNWDALVGPGFILLLVASFFLVLVGVVFNIIAFVLPFGLFAKARSLRNVRAKIDRAAPLATFQPNLSLALRDGETLTMTVTPHTANAPTNSTR